MKSNKRFAVYNFSLLFILFLSIAFIHKPVMTFFQIKAGYNEAAISVSAAQGDLTNPLKESPDYFSHDGKTKASFSEKEKIKVIPGGHSIGIQLETKGVLVVGHHYIDSGEGLISPALGAKIDIGDTILEMNGIKIQNLDQVKPIIETAGKEEDLLNITLKKKDKIYKTTLQPLLDEKSKSYSIGLYIRDKAAGIGTLSFYDPASKRYGALGHVISDVDTKKPIDLKAGKIVPSEVLKIQRGERNFPGEKRAKFSPEDQALGTVTKNSPFGIFGALVGEPENNYFQEAMEIAYSKDVKEGPAKILTVVNGEEIREYQIEIVNNKIQNSPSTKGMIIKITDEDLIEKTGGIVQGMSGSPIIQDNKLIGAITHVFVNDPTSGYAVHIEWMLEEAGITSYYENLKAS